MHSTAAARTQELVLGLSQTRSRDTLTLRREMIALLRRAVPFDTWCWGFADPDSHLLSSGTGDSPATNDLGRYLALEYGSDDLNRLLTLANGEGPAVAVLSQTTAGDLYRSRRWRELYHPYGVGDELRLALFADGYRWGYLELLRDRTGGHFTTEEAEFLLRLSVPMAKALRAALTCVSSPTTDVAHGPGTLILDAHNVIQATTPEADQWLALLRSYAIPIEALFPAPVPVLSMAARLRSLPEYPGALPTAAQAGVRVRTRTPAGHWLTIHASPLTGMAVPTGTVAVTIQHAAPADVAALVFHAHGLTARERQLARLLLEGLPNTEIAQRLYISIYTVRDHVKAVLDKLGVHSKRELIASILSQRL
ncbi:MAG TPA: LuxR C-terminal-related transcriptional regulator [Pseudonocardiaceae bacterium]|nr:LuxR C-terminal-related transcriptional regulator [Pseudonocardiaceae bacterium]